MRARTAAVFAFGFALGALAVALALHFRGTPDRSPGANSTADPAKARREARSNALPRGVMGNADRLIQPPRLALPIAGIAPNSLRDNFRDQRDGHDHEALDIPAPRGTPVMAVADGEVVKLFNSKAGGLTVYQFDRLRNWCFYYAHLDSYAAGLSEGAYLHTGDVLGFVGFTGNASPDEPHLHLAVFRLGPEKLWWKEITPFNPLPMLSRP